MASLILGLVESVRFYGLKNDAKEWTNLTTESLFAGYQPYLLEEFGIFFVDGTFGKVAWNIESAEDEMKALLYENLMATKKEDGMNWYRMDLIDAEVKGYLLATDDNGKVFEMQAANSMKSTVGKMVAEKILQRVEKVLKCEEKGEDPERVMTDAKEALIELEETKEKEDSKQETVEVIAENQEENPIETVEEIRGKGILAQVLPKGKTVSGKAISIENCLLKRTCRKGTYKQQENPGWYERILMQEFVKSSVGNFFSPKENGVLSYGTEYIICGKENDVENLEGVVSRLLWLRAVVNFLYLQQDEMKNTEALTVATAIAGAAANPAIIPVVQQGILAAWAYGESVCDVKGLLSGGKIPLMKNTNNWNTKLSNLGETVVEDYNGETAGLSYENYLDVLLYGKTVKEVAYRSMDLMEKSMQRKYPNVNCRMDNMIVGLKVEAEYEADMLFINFFERNDMGKYRFLERTEYVY